MAKNSFWRDFAPCVITRIKFWMNSFRAVQTPFLSRRTAFAVLQIPDCFVYSQFGVSVFLPSCHKIASDCFGRTSAESRANKPRASMEE